MDKLVVAVGAMVIGLGVLVLFSFLLSWPVYMLWNGCLVDAIEGVKQVTWLQAWGISFLSGMLFKNSNVKKD